VWPGGGRKDKKKIKRGMRGEVYSCRAPGKGGRAMRSKKGTIFCGGSKKRRMLAQPEKAMKKKRTFLIEQ